MAGFGDEENKHVIVIEAGTKSNKHQSKLECIHCGYKFTGSATRIRHHLLGISVDVRACTKPLQEAIENFKKLEEEKSKLKMDQERKRKLNALTKNSLTSPQQKSIKTMFNEQGKKVVDRAVARLFYRKGLPFHVVECHEWKDMLRVVGEYGPLYKSPNRNALATYLLDEAKQEVSSELQVIRERLEITGGTICSDGWSSVQNRPLLNFVLVTPKGEEFVRAIDTSGETKNASFICEELKKVIVEVGSTNIIQVITDNAANCKAAGDLIQMEFPHITWSGCAAHALDLLLHDIGGFNWVEDIIAEAREIVYFVTNHHRGLSIYREQKGAKQLLKPAETRFASNYILLGRLYEMKQILRMAVVDPRWQEWVDISQALKRTSENIVSKVLDVRTNGFWSKVKIIVDIAEPIIVLLRLVDSSKETIGKVYARMLDLEESLKGISESSNISKSQSTQVLNAHRARWTWMHSDLHSASFVLDPEFVDRKQGSNKEVVAGWIKIVARLVATKKDQALVMTQYKMFKTREGLFGRDIVIDSAKNMSASAWWEHFGAETPELQSIAIKILAQPSSASSCERNWSKFSFIHNKTRNRLTPERANDLVYVASNLGLLETNKTIGYSALVLAWMADQEDTTLED